MPSPTWGLHINRAIRTGHYETIVTLIVIGA